MIYGALLGDVPLAGFFSQTKLTAQNMIISPVMSPCYDPCTVTAIITWVNNTSGSLPTGQIIGITVDGVIPPNGTTATTRSIPVGGTVSHTFTLTGLLHTYTNLICPTPN
jgi:hypothetical protein